MSVRDQILPLILSRRRKLSQAISVDTLDPLTDGVFWGPGKRARSSQLNAAAHVDWIQGGCWLLAWMEILYQLLLDDGDGIAEMEKGWQWKE